MSRCLDCTECRTCPGKMDAENKDSVWCRQGIFASMPSDQAFLSVERKCVYFEKEGVDGNTSGDQRSDS